jgi:hypothetical protein
MRGKKSSRVMDNVGVGPRDGGLKSCLLTSRTLLRTKLRLCSHVPKMICSRGLINLCNICVDGSDCIPYNDAGQQWSCIHSRKVMELEAAIQNLMITRIVEDCR